MVRRIKLAVIANEFMAPEIGLTGGFGWAARAVARTFLDHPQAGVDVVFISNGIAARNGKREITVHDTRLLLSQSPSLSMVPILMREKIDLILAVDYRPNYRRLFWMLPRTPIIVWARDPRTPTDDRRIELLRIPGQEDVRPYGTNSFNCRSLARVALASRLLFRRRVLLASKTPHLIDKLTAAYGLWDSHVLPNPDILPYALLDRTKHPSPRVVFLGRLDPIKRPWLFVELARRFPDVEFLLAGRPHSCGPGSWQPDGLPANVRLLGEVHGNEKIQLIGSSWVAVNTSIHEASPVSVQEALACETPVLSCLDRADPATQFGISIGLLDGAGFDGLPALEAGLRRLLDDTKERKRLGREGRDWVMREQNTQRFLEAFASLVKLSGVRA